MSEYRREYLLRLPLPLAQLYGAANNSRDSMTRADKAFAGIEVAIRMGAAVMLTAYRTEVRQGAPRDTTLDKLMYKLEQPTLRDWLTILTSLADHFGTRGDADTHPLGHIREQLQKPRPHSTGMLGLTRVIERMSWLEQVPTAVFNVQSLLDRVVRYVRGTGDRDDSGEETLTESISDIVVLPALHELFEEGVFDVIGPSDSRLVWIESVRAGSQELAEIDCTDLVGLNGERLDPITISKEKADGLKPNQVAILWPTRPCPVPVAPLLHLRVGDLNSEMLFATAYLPGKHVDYRAYSQFEPIRIAGMSPGMLYLIADLTGDSSVGVVPTVFDGEESVRMSKKSGLAPNQIRVRLLEKPAGDFPSEWVFAADEEIPIGRELSNKAIIIHPRVSRRHAIISHSTTGWKYRNLGANGTLRQGTRCDEFTITSGEIVQLAAKGPRVQFDLP